MLSYSLLQKSTPCLKKTVHFCFCQNFVKFAPILINFGKWMAKWLKLYTVYTFSTSPNPWYRTTSWNTHVPNFCLTLKFSLFFATKNMVTELAHGKFKYGLFSRVISCHDRSAHNCQNSCNLTRTLLHLAGCIFVFGPRQLYLLHGVPRSLARRGKHFPWWIAGSVGQEFTRYEFDEEWLFPKRTLVV